MKKPLYIKNSFFLRGRLCSLMNFIVVIFFLPSNLIFIFQVKPELRRTTWKDA